MKSTEIVKSAEELIEKAKQLSKEQIITFYKEQYGVDVSTAEKLWAVPLVPTYEYERIFPIELSKIDEDALLDIIDTCIVSQLGNEPMAVIPREYIVVELPTVAMAEYDEKVGSQKNAQKYESAIVYDESALISMYREHLQAGFEAEQPYTKEQIDEIFVNDIAKHFTHERTHIITNKNIITYQNSDKIDALEFDKEHENESEVLIDIMARIISQHKAGESITNSLEEVLKDREKVLKKNGVTSYYSDKDDALVTTMFALFPEELSRWIMFEAHDGSIPNVYIQKCSEVMGQDNKPKGEALFNMAGEYFNKSMVGQLTPEQLAQQKKMLEIIGVKNISLEQEKKIGVEELMVLIFSKEAMEEFNNGSRVVEGAQDAIER